MTWCEPNPRKVQAPTNMPLLKTKKELHLFLDIINYLSKVSPMTAQVCEQLKKLRTSVKADWTWKRRMYQVLNDRAKKIVVRPLYLENDASGISLGSRLLQVKGGMNCRCN